MRFSGSRLLYFSSQYFSAKGPIAQVHPSESLGRIFFESLKTRDFNTYFSQSIFSLNEQSFKFFLQTIRNQSMRDHLIKNHPLAFPADANTSKQKWEIAFLHNWRTE